MTMKIIGVLLFSFSLGIITVNSPTELKAELTSLENPQGLILFSASTFGSSFLYAQTRMINLVLPEPGNEEGCSKLGIVSANSAYLLKRGGCTFSKKAFVGSLSGASAVFVYSLDPQERIKDVIPIPDSICMLIRQQHQNSYDSHPQ